MPISRINIAVFGKFLSLYIADLDKFLSLDIADLDKFLSLDIADLDNFLSLDIADLDKFLSLGIAALDNFLSLGREGERVNDVSVVTSALAHSIASHAHSSDIIELRNLVSTSYSSNASLLRKGQC